MVRKSKQSGFSLMELMIVVAIMAIMASFATPSFLKWRANFKVKGAARDLLGNMQKAKLIAVRERTNVTVEFNSGGNSYRVYIDENDDGAYAAADDTLVVNEVWDSDVYYDASVSDDGIKFAFDQIKTEFGPTGIPNLKGSIYITNNNNKKLKVALSSAGNIRIAEY